MLSEEDDVEIHALAARGWTKAAIARHTGRDRKTVSKYLNRPPGPRREPAPSYLEPFRGYLEARFADDAHVDATVLYRELVDAGFTRSYPTLVREIRRLELRPVCTVCQHYRGQDPTVEIEHPAGEEIQWDWLELHDTPWGEPAFVLIGALSHSSRFRAVFCEQMTCGHLADAVHRVLVGLAGTARVWRTDRIATIVIPGTDRLTVDAANLAKHYGVEVAVCPPRRAQRNAWSRRRCSSPPGHGGGPPGSRRWPRHRSRWIAGPSRSPTAAPGRAAPGEIGAAEPLRALPALAYLAMITVQRNVSRTALLAFNANPYRVPPTLTGRTVTVQARVGEPILRSSPKPGRWSRRTARPRGPGRPSARRNTPRCWRRPCSRHSPPTTAAEANRTGRPAPTRSPSSRS